jgi:hypothetical protein
MIVMFWTLQEIEYNRFHFISMIVTCQSQPSALNWIDFNCILLGVVGSLSSCYFLFLRFVFLAFLQFLLFPPLFSAHLFNRPFQYGKTVHRGGIQIIVTIGSLEE